jgi:hypothetical protein
MADRLWLVRHWHPVQQATRPCFRRGQLPVVAEISDDTGEDDRSQDKRTRPKTKQERIHVWVRREVAAAGEVLRVAGLEQRTMRRPAPPSRPDSVS